MSSSVLSRGVMLPAVIGPRVSHYRIIEKLGSGGMGIVYKAEDVKLGRFVVLKFLPELLLKNQESLERFRREARTASALNHPNICTIYEIGEHEGQPFIAMELLEGRTLRESINRQPLMLEQIIDLAIEITDALDATHSSGILHRDIKPANLFVSNRQHAKILDFGLAKPVPETLEGFAEDDATQLAVHPTEPGTALGTVAYMSPEQVRGEDLDGRSDIFSFGAVLYEMATGRQAFTGKTTAAIFGQIMHEAPLPARQLNPDIHPELERIINKALAKDRTSRYQTAADVHADFLALRKMAESASSRRPYRWLATAAIVGVFLLAAAYVGQRLRPSAEHGLRNITFTKMTTQPGLEFFPSFSPDGRMFVYASPASGNWDIFLQRVGGQNPLNLTSDSPEDDTQPQFSPNGESIVFRSERDGGGIYVMGATGESVRRLTDFGFNPAWAPNQKEVVFAEETVTDAPSFRARPSSL